MNVGEARAQVQDDFKFFTEWLVSQPLANRLPADATVSSAALLAIAAALQRDE